MAAGKALLSVAREILWKELPPETAYAKAFHLPCAHQAQQDAFGLQTQKHTHDDS